MVKNQKGDVVVLVVVVVAIFAILGLGFWLIFSSKKQSSEILNEKGTLQQQDKDTQTKTE